MYSSITIQQLAEDARANGEFRTFTNLDTRNSVGSSALRDMIGGSETLQYIEYDCMAVKHNDASQKREPNVELSTFSLNGRPYDFHKLMGLPVLAQRLKAAIPAVSESDSTLRKVFLLTAQVTETVYLWRGQVMRSFEELSTAVCADLEAKAAELHDPTWAGLQKEQPEHVQAVIIFQDKVLNALQELVEELRASVRDKRPGSNNLLWKALQRMGQHAAGPSQEADISFHAMLLFCAVVPMDMRVQVTRVLDDCFRAADPQTSAGPGPSQGDRSDEGDTSDDLSESEDVDKTAAKPVYSREFVVQSCMDMLNNRPPNSVALSTIATGADDFTEAEEGSDDDNGSDSADDDNGSNSADDDSADDDSADDDSADDDSADDDSADASVESVD